MISEWRPVRASLALLLLAIAVFAAALTVRNAFLPDVVAVADTDGLDRSGCCKLPFYCRRLRTSRDLPFFSCLRRPSHTWSGGGSDRSRRCRASDPRAIVVSAAVELSPKPPVI